MKAEEMWKQYCDDPSIQYDAWSFGDDPDGLAKLVYDGVKTATASAYILYEIEKEPLPEVGGYSVVLNSKKEAVCIIRTVKVYVESFRNVGSEHAYKEGEKDRSLSEWRNIHRSFFENELKSVNLEFDEDMKVVCEEFEVVYK